MIRRRFFAPPGAFASDQQSVALASDEAKHLRDVLRLKVGDEAYVFDGAGREFQCAVAEMRRDAATLRVVAETQPTRPESPMRLTLALALLKGEKFDLVVQKATELGVKAIIPVISSLADRRLPEISRREKRTARWRRIALEAAKQSGRATLPTVAAVTDFAALLAQGQREGETRLLFSEHGGTSLLDAASSAASPPTAILALVGSEGGWTDEELRQARAEEWQIVTLGGRTLRAETAAIVITALLQNLFGDLK